MHEADPKARPGSQQLEEDEGRSLSTLCRQRHNVEYADLFVSGAPSQALLWTFADWYSLQ